MDAVRVLSDGIHVSPLVVVLVADLPMVFRFVPCLLQKAGGADWFNRPAIPMTPRTSSERLAFVPPPRAPIKNLRTTRVRRRVGIGEEAACRQTGVYDFSLYVPLCLCSYSLLRACPDHPSPLSWAAGVCVRRSGGCSYVCTPFGHRTRLCDG